jgi:hypothetical protein
MNGSIVVIIAKGKIKTLIALIIAIFLCIILSVNIVERLRDEKES